MKKIYNICRKLLFLSLLLLLFSGCSNQVSDENLNLNSTVIQEVKEVIEPTQENFMKILETNKDGIEYLEKYPNTQVVSFKKIKPENFDELKNQTQYKELYINLPDKELYAVDFNGGSQLSLTTIIDLEEKKVLKIFGIFIIGMK